MDSRGAAAMMGSGGEGESRKRIGRVDEGWSSGEVQLENEDGRAGRNRTTGGRRGNKGYYTQHKDSRKKGRRLRTRFVTHKPPAIIDCRFRPLVLWLIHTPSYPIPRFMSAAT